MHGGELVKELGVDKLQARLEQFGTNNQGQHATQHQHGETEQHVHGAYVFVIGRVYPATPSRWRMTVVIAVVRMGWMV